MDGWLYLLHSRTNGVPVETGSLDRGKAALERRKKAAEEGPAIGRVEFTRVNPNPLIDQILKAANIGEEDTSQSKIFLENSFFLSWIEDTLLWDASLWLEYHYGA